MEIVLNELSVCPDPALSVDARGVELAECVKGLSSLGVGRVLRSTRDVLERDLDVDLSFRRWLFARSGPREQKRYLATLLSKAPYVNDLHTREENAQGKLFEFQFEKAIALGLGLAFLRDFPAVSLRCNCRFLEASLPVKMLVLVLEREQSVEKDVTVVHVARREHVSTHRLWLEGRVQRVVRTGRELWARREELFPFLDFCARVEKQLEEFDGTEPFFPEIVRHLHVLSRTAVDWQGAGEFDPPLRWSHESKPTMANPALAAERTYVCLDSVQRVFSPHSKIGSAKRIAFLPDAERHRVWVGHIGEHLPTARFR